MIFLYGFYPSIPLEPLLLRGIDKDSRPVCLPVLAAQAGKPE